MINLADIATGDLVIIQDQHGNVASGVADVGPRTQTLDAFDKIIYAKRPTDRYKWQRHPEIKVVGHTSAMFGAGVGQ